MEVRRKREIPGRNASSLNLDAASKRKAESLFEKMKTYTKNKQSPWKLPQKPKMTSTYPSCLLPELQELKERLNKVKEKLSDKEILDWHQHTQFMNLAGSVVQEVRRSVRPELCTQAWCKFYELLSTYDIVDLNQPDFNSVHICEAPGAFITSLNHYLISKGYDGTWTWYANTLNPWYEGNSVGEMIDDDHFIRDTKDQWFFGPDDTGNIMEHGNLTGLVQRCEEMGDIHLVTADGSIDCQDDPGEQERVVSRLHYCEVLTALLILAPGGHLVLKKFTMFESDTVCLMYLLNCLFEEVNVMKPATSKSGNSEVYAVCKGFMGIKSHRELMGNLCQTYFHTDDSVLPQSIFLCDQIPQSFLSQHINICKFFTNLQIETIKTNLEHYPDTLDQYRMLTEAIRNYCAAYYLDHYDLWPIPDTCRIVPFKNQKRILQTSNVQKKNNKFKDKKHRSGTFNDRQRLNKLPWKQKVLEMEKLDVAHSHPAWFKHRLGLGERDLELEMLTKGKCPDKVLSSKFCDSLYICILNEFWEKTTKANQQISMSVEMYGEALNKALMSLDTIQCREKKEVILILQRFTSDFDAQQVFALCPEINQLICSDNIGLATESTNEVYILDGLVNPKCCSHDQEMMSQQYLVTLLSKNLTKLKVGDDVIIQISTSLTRFTAGLMYLLTMCFQRISLLPVPAGISLQQFLICDNFQGSSDFLCQYFNKLCEFSGNSQDNRCLLESVPAVVLFSDLEFVNFLKGANEVLVKSYINSVIDLTKSLQ